MSPLHQSRPAAENPAAERQPFRATLVAEAEAALSKLPTPDEDSRRYLEKHIPRLARTIALAPQPIETGRALELGCYMQITPFLHFLRGYREVRGAYYGPAGRIDTKSVRVGARRFTCEIDNFDAERDPFPYPDRHFDLVVAGEIIEHMIFDPMHLLTEARRVLVEGGRILITTPNVASVTSIAKALDGTNPQIYSQYKRPGGEPEIGHVREYTARELRDLVCAAGFEIETLFTTFLEEYAAHRALLGMLEANGYATNDRGEQSWCVARKDSRLEVERYPGWLYAE